MSQYYVLKSRNEFGVDVEEAYASTVERLFDFAQEEGVSEFKIFDQDGSFVLDEVVL